MVLFCGGGDDDGGTVKSEFLTRDRGRRGQGAKANGMLRAFVRSKRLKNGKMEKVTPLHSLVMSAAAPYTSRVNPNPPPPETARQFARKIAALALAKRENMAEKTGRYAVEYCTNDDAAGRSRTLGYGNTIRFMLIYMYNTAVV